MQLGGSLTRTSTVPVGHPTQPVLPYLGRRLGKPLFLFWGQQEALAEGASLCPDLLLQVFDQGVVGGVQLKPCGGACRLCTSHAVRLGENLWWVPHQKVSRPVQGGGAATKPVKARRH